jgi:hypothetical protein
MTQKDLAARLNLPYYTVISQLETGQITVPPSMWSKLATVLMMDPLDFSLQCLTLHEEEIYKALFDGAKPFQVYRLLSSLHPGPFQDPPPAENRSMQCQDQQGARQA